MPLEATMLIIDNSEFSRNGDYVPTRFGAQSDAVTTVFQTKIDSNPENTVGIMTMAGKGPEVLVTHSKSHGQIIQALHRTSTSKIGGTIDIPTSISVAQLALKHRENKNLRQRIIVFVGSPLDGAGKNEKHMVSLAKKLKKNNVAIDVVCYGDGIEEESETQQPLLQKFVETANSGDNSHLVVIPPSGTVLLSEALISSPILSGDRQAAIPDELMPGAEAGAGGAGGSGSNQFEFGVDPSLDPELAMALRMSMQEAQAAAAASSSAGPSTDAAAAVPAPPADKPAVTAEKVPNEIDEDDEDALLAQAIALSTQDNNEDVEMGEGHEDVSMDDDDDEEDEDEEDEDAAIARAIEMSMQQQTEEDAAKKSKK